jgi:hypothetical protein
MTIVYHTDFEQGSGDWTARRCGMLTASEVKHIITPTLKRADNDKSRQHLYELLAQRITNYVEPHYIGDAMMRGQQDEIWARELYAEKYAPVTECAFITNDKLGFMLGYSPDGLVGDDGLIEVKSRAQKYQVQTIIEDAMPVEYSLQVQFGLLVSERKWCDFVSYSSGLPMFVARILPDPVVASAIVSVASDFHASIAEKIRDYETSAARFHATERREYGIDII